MGIIQLPNGCVLVITDKQGRMTKVKGQPLYRMIEGEQVTLTMNGPLNEILAKQGKNETQKVVTAEGLITSHLTPVVLQIDSIDQEIKSQYIFIWSLIGCLIFVTLVCVVIIIYIYMHYAKIFAKIRMIKQSFSDILVHFAQLVEAKERFVHLKDAVSAHVRPRTHIMGNRFKKAIFSPRTGHRVVQGPPLPEDHYIELQQDDIPPYVSMDELRQSKPITIPRPMSKMSHIGFRPVDNDVEANRGPYPRLTPLLRAASVNEVDDGKPWKLNDKVPTRSRSENPYYKTSKELQCVSTVNSEQYKSDQKSKEDPPSDWEIKEAKQSDKK